METAVTILKLPTMKKIIVLLLIIASTASFGQTYFFAEQQNYCNKNSVSPTAFIWASKYWQGSRVGAFVFALTSPTYGEFLIGPNYTFRGNTAQKFIEVGVAGGFDSKPRGAAYLFFNANPDSTGKKQIGKCQGLLNAEYGGTGYWYLGFVTYNVTNKIGLGIHAQSYNGVWGPRLQFQTGGLMLYVTAGQNLELKEKAILAALRYYF